MKKYSRIILSIPQEDYCITASPGEYPLASTLMTAPYTNLSLRTQMQDAVTHLERWAVQNKMELNAKKTKDMWITFKKSCPIPAPINIGPTELERVSEFKLLGVYVQNDLKWNTHVSSIVSKACKRIHYLTVCRTAHLPRDIGLTTYTTKIRICLACLGRAAHLPRRISTESAE